MSDSQAYGPHVDLKIRTCECILEHLRKEPCAWQWPIIREQFDRLERLVGELRAELEPPELDDTVARIKLYRSNTGSGWTAAWFVDRPGDRAPAAGGLVGHHETWRSAYGAALACLEDHLHVP